MVKRREQSDFCWLQKLQKIIALSNNKINFSTDENNSKLIFYVF